MTEFDVIIIGGGPAGLSAAVYTSRAELKTLVLDEENKLLDKVEKIENYFGFPEGISGRELLKRGREQAEKFGTKVIKEKVLLVKASRDTYLVETTDSKYEGSSLIISPGIQHKRPTVDDIKAYEGQGVSYCVTCDAPLFKGKKVGILGSKDLAVKEALELHDYTEDIKIYTNGKELKVGEEMRKKLREKDIPVVEKKIEGVKGDENFEGLLFKEGEEEMKGLMIAEGTSGSIDFAKSLGIRIEDDSLIVDKEQFSGLPGVYAAGDCTGGARQIGAAVGEGAKAALNLIDEIKGEDYFDWKH